MRYALLTCTDESAVISDEERSWRAAALTSFEEQMRENQFDYLLASEHAQASLAEQYAGLPFEG